MVESGRLATVPPLEILQAEDLKIHKNSAIIYSESERDVTLLLTKHYWVATYRKKEVPK